MYDSKIGRWTTIDPNKQHWSSYLAMGNNPLNKYDPDGRDDWYLTSQNTFIRVEHNSPYHAYFDVNGKFISAIYDEDMIDPIKLTASLEKFAGGRSDMAGDINLYKAFYQRQNNQDRYQMQYKAKSLGFLDAYTQMETVYSLTGAAIIHEDVATVYSWLSSGPKLNSVGDIINTIDAADSFFDSVNIDFLDLLLGKDYATPADRVDPFSEYNLGVRVDNTTTK